MDGLDWEDVTRAAEDWALQAAAPAWDVRQAAAGVYTVGDVGYYYQPASDGVALLGRGAAASDLGRCKAAAAAAVGRDHVRDDPLADAATGGWIKVAYSPTVRRLGEWLNFFPGTYPGGIPNAPSPLAAMLTTALVGGGLGYGGGRLARAVLPAGYGENLPRSLALAGALGGGAVAAPWALYNVHAGRSLLDPAPFNPPPDSPPEFNPEPGGAPPPPDLADWLQRHDPAGAGLRELGGGILPTPAAGHGKRGSDLCPAYLRAVYAFVKRADLFGQFVTPRPPQPADVNINALGQTLWESGASPQLTAMTMGSMFAAGQMPDANARPGWVTGHQLGELAASAASSYAKGLAAGAVINAVVGTPWTPPAFGVGGAALGLLGAVVPKLFG